MRKESVITFCAAAAVTIIGATLFAPSGAQAVPLTVSSELKTAISHTTSSQEAHYICRRHGRKCYYVSRPDRYLHYYRPYANEAYPQRMPWDYWAAPNKN
jgi:hypothetical protein